MYTKNRTESVMQGTSKLNYSVFETGLARE